MNVRSQYGQEHGLSTAQVASAELQLDKRAKGSMPRLCSQQRTQKESRYWAARFGSIFSKALSRDRRPNTAPRQEFAQTTTENRKMKTL
jgi:hypothetical protein